MAEQEPLTLASTFPNPPPFWKDFTPDKLARIEELRSNAARDGNDNSSDANATSVRIPNVPEDLINLQPPAEPADGRWRVFGDQYMVCGGWHLLFYILSSLLMRFPFQLDDKLPTLEDQGIENLPATGPSSAKDAKHYDRAFELKRLAKSLLLNFLELAGIMSLNPAHAEAKIADLRTLFINMHHIVNEYRPHQARESAIEMMQEHLDRTRTETMAIRAQVDKAKRVLEGLGSLGLEGTGTTIMAGGSAEEEEEREERLAVEREADVWASADALLL